MPKAVFLYPCTQVAVIKKSVLNRAAAPHHLQANQLLPRWSDRQAGPSNLCDSAALRDPVAPFGPAGQKVRGLTVGSRAATFS